MSVVSLNQTFKSYIFATFLFFLNKTHLMGAKIQMECFKTASQKSACFSKIKKPISKTF